MQPLLLYQLKILVKASQTNVDITLDILFCSLVFFVVTLANLLLAGRISLNKISSFTMVFLNCTHNLIYFQNLSVICIIFFQFHSFPRFYSPNIPLICLSKSESIRWVLLKISYSLSAFVLACAADIRPLSGNI